MTPKYKDLPTRIICSVICALIIVHQSTTMSFLELIRTPNYPYGIISSALIGLSIAWLVRLITKKLDRHLSWDDHIPIRLGVQILFGVVAVFIITVLGVTLYFLGAGIFTDAKKPIWIVNTPWFSFLAFPVLLLIVFANCYYFVYYMIVKQKAATTTNQRDLNKNDGVKEKELFYGRPFSDVVYASSTADSTEAITKDGKSFPWSYGIKRGLVKLPAGEYIDAGRSELVRLDNIKRSEYLNVEKTKMRVYLIVPEDKAVDFSRNHTAIHKTLLRAYL
ncbi:MAG: hypothetical protein EOO92_17530 [Pedobacter sp.]|nr:MAG: hypothetical protein EOO92_17530 [Pedobacter sp.]